VSLRKWHTLIDASMLNAVCVLVATGRVAVDTTY
jgi:hypothetical protein